VRGRRASWWERGLKLTPGPLLRPPTRADILIVGAGFTGRWLAYHLARLPAPPSVLVLERDAFTYGASSRNAGFLTCGQLSEMSADVRVAGLDAVVGNFLRRLQGIQIVRGAFPDLEVDECGSYDWDPLTAEQRELARTLNEAAGREVYRIGTAQIEGEPRAAAHNLLDGGLDPVDLLERLRAATDATFRFGLEVQSIGGGVAEVVMGAETHEVRYRHAFVATNAFSSSLHPKTPVRPGRGQVIVTSPVASERQRALGYLNEGYDYFRWLGDRLLIGGGRHLHPEENGPIELTPTDDVGAYLTRTAARVIGHDDFAVDHHWAGIMGFHEGRHLGGPPREALDATTDVVAGFGGMGVALTPAVAADIVAELR